jgi:hypothetical protein
MVLVVLQCDNIVSASSAGRNTRRRTTADNAEKDLRLLRT